jgi:hypothetical protein
MQLSGSEHLAWLFALIERLGLGGTILLIFAIAVGYAIATKLDRVLSEAKGILDVVLKHRRESARIQDMIASRKKALDAKLKGRSRRKRSEGDG